MSPDDADFSGWATKANLKCSDGRTIMPNAFEHQDKVTVPLVWAHGHREQENILGYAVLEHRDEGVYTYGYFNETPQGVNAKALVQHGDVKWLSIFANELVEKSKQVFHGAIREVSLVLAGANPGAKIENVRIAHSLDPEDFDEIEGSAYITTGEALQHSDESSTAGDKPEEEPEEEPVEEADDAEETEDELDPKEVLESMTEDQQVVVHAMIEHALTLAGDATTSEEALAHADATVEDVIKSMNEQQKNVLYYMVGMALEGAGNTAAHSAENGTTEDTLTHQEGTTMTRNVFDQTDVTAGKSLRHAALTAKGLAPELSHDDMAAIQTAAKKDGSFKEAFLAHATSLGYGIDDIEFLFPDAKSVTSQPDLISRRTEWVAGIIDGAKHSPFSRIKSLAADLTADEARAKGYVKGNLKKEEVIKLLRRSTTPTTVYKKQKLDRDDILDITDLDVVAWLKWEMRFMIEEEIARAILLGDGREPDDDDKIDEDHLRPIAFDDDMYAHKVTVPTGTSGDALIESIIRSRKHFKGTGTPTLYTTDDILTDMLLVKDKMQRRIYANEADLAATLRVAKIVPVEVMEGVSDILGILVNIADYTIGADKGGQLTMFEDFDIDYNQEKYLIETRISGALTKPKSAVVIKRVSGNTVSPTAPGFNQATNTITIPTVVGVTYYDDADDSVLAAGDHVITETTDVVAKPNSGYNFPHNYDADWTYAFVDNG